MDMQEMFEKIEVQINKKIEFAEDFRYRYGLQEAMATVKDVINEYQYEHSESNHIKKRLTRKDYFFKKFPHSKRCLAGIPNMCVVTAGFIETCPYFIPEKYAIFLGTSDTCINCWSEPLSEEGDK